VTRTVRALELLAFAPLSAPQVAASLQIHQRTARRLVERLREEDYLERSDDHPRLYSPSLRLVAVAGQLLNRLRLAQQAVPFVARLQAQTGGAAHLAIPSYRSALCIVHAAPDWPAHPELRELAPCHCTAPGKMLLAERQAWRDSVLSGPVRAHTRRTTTDRARLRAELDTARRLGYAVEREELRDGECGVAAPVANSGGTIAALGVSVDNTVGLEALSELVVDTAEGLARALAR